MPLEQMTSVAEEESESQSNRELEAKRINCMKTALNLYRSRALSLGRACESLMSSATVPDHMKSYDFLRKQYQSLQNDVALLTAFEDSLGVIHNTITALNISNLEDYSLRRDLQKTVSEIVFFSNYLMKLYEENFDEISIIEAKVSYSTALNSYKKNLQLVKDQQRELSYSPEELRKWEKAEMQVKKLNFIREMKQILIAKFAGNKQSFPHIQQLRSPHRRNLTLEDFVESSNIDL